MLSSLAIAYLFVGGSGAGALFASQVIDLLWVKPTDADVRLLGVTEQRSVHRVLSLSVLFGTVAVALGIVCLVFDLGRMDRALQLFLSPTPSFMSLGAFSLAALLVCGLVLSVVRCAYAPWFSPSFTGPLRIVVAVLSFIVMAYTGLLLMSIQGVAFWRTALIPALFAASSLSCGLALVLIAAALAERDAQASWLLRRIALCDAVVVAVELAVAALFLFVSLTSDRPARAASAASLLDEHAIAWWGGFIFCGTIVPLLVEGAALRRMLEPFWERDPFPRTGVMLLVAAAVLMGGASLRAGVVEAGQHRALELQPSPELALVKGESGADDVGSSRLSASGVGSESGKEER